MSLRTHLASNGDGRENAIVELPECREYLELQRRVFANAYFSKQKVKSKVAQAFRVKSLTINERGHSF